MTQLIHCSKAKENVTLEDVKDILNLSNAKNKEFDLSRMLIYNSTYFLQCIEGKYVYSEKKKNKFNENDNFFPYDMSFDDAKSALIHFSKGL